MCVRLFSPSLLNFYFVCKRKKFFNRKNNNNKNDNKNT